MPALSRKLIIVGLLRHASYSDLRVAISMEKRYFTSDLSSRSQASMSFWMGMTSTSAVMLCAPQKLSISWVSGMPPMNEPERLRRPSRRPKAETVRGFTGAPTRVILPSRRRELVDLSALTLRMGSVDEARGTNARNDASGLPSPDRRNLPR